MSTVGQRVSYLLDYMGVDIKDFCVKNGIAYNNLIQVKNDSRPLGSNVMFQLKVAVPNLNINWLYFDEGTMFISKNDNNDSKIEKVEEPSVNYEVSDPFEKTFLTYLEKPKSKAIMEKHIKNVIAQLDLGTGAPHTISHGEENSELMQRIENELKNQKGEEQG